MLAVLDYQRFLRIISDWTTVFWKLSVNVHAGVGIDFPPFWASRGRSSYLHPPTFLHSHLSFCDTVEHVYYVGTAEYTVHGRAGGHKEMSSILADQ